jgi:serine/threonine protein kinase
MSDAVPNTTAPADRLLDLLDQWRALQQQGQCVTAAQVCTACPELAGDLERFAQFVGQVETLAGDTGAGETLPSAGATGRQECRPHSPGSEAQCVSTDPRLDELMSRWHRARLQGQEPTPAELCRDCPELLSELQTRLDALRSMEQLLETRAGPAADGADAGKRYDFLAPAQGPGEIGRLGQYRVLKVLGAGGMGMVFQAEDTQLRRLVALKVMLPGTASSAAAHQRFLREAQAAAALDHDHIVHIYQVGKEGNVPFLAMQFLHGESLHSRLAREGRLGVAEIVRIGQEIADGLAAAHAHGLIHRDIKPANLWLEAKDERGMMNDERKTDYSSFIVHQSSLRRVKILDFGLARAAQSDVRLTATGAILGTPAYMAPEQARGDAVDPRSDLFSLGCVLYEMATGERPFKGANTMAILMALANHNPRPPAEINRDVPPELSDLVMKLLAKDPAGRPATARAVFEALQTIAQQQGPPSTIPAPASPTKELPRQDGGGITAKPGEHPTARIRDTSIQPTLDELPPPPRQRSRRLVVAALAVAVVAVLGGLTWRLWPDQKDPAPAVPAPPVGPSPVRAAAVRIRPLQVVHYQTIANQEEARGKIGDKSFATHHGDAVTLTVELSAPAYCYVIGFNFDGKEQLLWPMDDKGEPTDQMAPPQVKHLHLPPGQKRLYLDDPAKSGLQAYVVAASNQPLPPYARWRAERKGVAWKPLPPGKAVWQADDAAAYAVLPGLGADRGTIKEAPGVPPLAGLCRALKGGGVEAVEAIAFPVLPKEGQ